MWSFTVIWFGQLLSILGSSITRFTLVVWVFQTTGSVTQSSLLAMCATLPQIFVSFVAGPLVDRWPRRRVMLLSDSLNALTSLGTFIFLSYGHLPVWYIYLVATLNATFDSFQSPAYGAAIPLLVPKEHLNRANGMVQTSEAIGQTVSPIVASLLIVSIGLQGIILIDLSTFCIAFVTLIFSSFPELETKVQQELSLQSLFAEFLEGWNYVQNRSGLFGLLLLSSVSRLLFGFVIILFPLFVLSFYSTVTLGSIESLGGIAMVAGSLVMIILPGSGRSINSIFGMLLLQALCFIAMGCSSSTIVFGAGVVTLLFSIPILRTRTQVIWQRKVEPSLQGRISALRRIFEKASVPISALLAGPLDDKIFEPLISPNGPLAEVLGKYIGVGKGHGINLMFILAGLLGILVTLTSYQYPRLRLVEDELPDVLPESPGPIAVLSDKHPGEREQHSEAQISSTP